MLNVLEFNQTLQSKKITTNNYFHQILFFLLKKFHTFNMFLRNCPLNYPNTFKMN